MEMIQNLLNGENSSPLQLVLITLFLVICLILIVWIVRRIAGSPARRAGRGRIPRLSITDSAAVDDKRYIVLVRRDNVEHLLMIGGPTDVVVETGIMRVQPVAKPGEAMKPASTKPVVKAAPMAPEAKPAKEKPLFGTATGAVTAVGTVAAKSNEVSADAQQNGEDAAEKAADKVETAEKEVKEPPSVEPAKRTDKPAEAEEVKAEATETAEATDNAETAEVAEPAEAPEVTPETSEAPDLEPDLEDTITQKLDDVLSAENFELDEAPNAEKSADNNNEKPDDEMQRLLEELAGEAKQPAQ